MMPVAKSLAQHLDDLVRWTGIPGFVMRPPRQRRLRWLPLIVLAAGFALYAMAALHPAMPYLAIYSSAFGTLTSIGAAIHAAGPLRQNTGLDEREAVLQRDAYLVTFVLIGALYLVGTLLIAGFTVLEDWSRDRLLAQMLGFLGFLFLIFILMPTAYASWALPDEDVED